MKYPKPNNQPYKKKSFLLLIVLDFLIKKIKKKLNVKKFTIKQLKGGKLNEVIAPNKNNNTSSIYNFLINLFYFRNYGLIYLPLFF